MTEVCSDGRRKLTCHIAPHQLASLTIDLTPFPITISTTQYALTIYTDLLNSLITILEYHAIPPLKK